MENAWILSGGEKFHALGEDVSLNLFRLSGSIGK